MPHFFKQRFHTLKKSQFARDFYPSLLDLFQIYPDIFKAKFEKIQFLEFPHFLIWDLSGKPNKLEDQFLSYFAFTKGLESNGNEKNGGQRSFFFSVNIGDFLHPNTLVHIG